MARPLRAIIYGLGTTGRMSAAYLRDKGVDVVAAYVRTIEGKDFSAPELKGVQICQPHVPFETFGADILVSTHCSTLADLREPALRAAAAGLDVVTIAEDAFDPFYPDAATPVARELDAAFRAHGKTLASVGVQDTFWFAQPLSFLTAVQRLTRLTGVNVADVSKFGTAVRHAKVLGLTADEFRAQGFGAPTERRGVFDTALRPLIRALGLRVETVTVTNEPVLAEADLYVPRFDKHVPAGTACGSMERAVFTLTGGIVVEGQFMKRFLPEGVTAWNEWIVEGTPSMNLRTDRFRGDVITCASLVNRVRDVIDAAPGFLGVDDLAMARPWADLPRCI